MIASNIFDEFVDFIASKSPHDILTFKPSEKSSRRYEELILKEKTQGLESTERQELANFQVLEHIMRRAKAKARLILAA